MTTTWAVLGYAAIPPDSRPVIVSLKGDESDKALKEPYVASRRSRWGNPLP